jgi:hypothetical protein
MGVSAGHLTNICRGRKRLFPHVLNRARASLRERSAGRAGNLRLLSAKQWSLEHGGQSYESWARERGFMDDDLDEEGVW